MSLEDRIREAVEGFVARARQDLDVHGQGLAVNVTSALRDHIVNAQSDLEQAVGSERTRAAAELEALKEKVDKEHASEFGRLLGTVRELDGAISLRGILEALAAGVRTETVRSALLLLDLRTFRAISAFGYSDAQTPTEVQVDADSLLVRAVEGLAPVEVPSPGRDGGTPLGRPNFLRPPAGHVGRLMPLAVGGNVVAVLYSEGLDPRAEGQAGEVWIDAIEILVRHAALRLENVTSIRTVEALTR
jgi:hypothetical protein